MIEFQRSIQNDSLALIRAAISSCHRRPYVSCVIVVKPKQALFIRATYVRAHGQGNRGRLPDIFLFYVLADFLKPRC